MTNDLRTVSPAHDWPTAVVETVVCCWCGAVCQGPSAPPLRTWYGSPEKAICCECVARLYTVITVDVARHASEISPEDLREARRIMRLEA